MHDHHAAHAAPAPFIDAKAISAASTSNATITFACCSYSPNSVTIDAGESVTWTGDFEIHPLVQVDGPTSDETVPGGFECSFGTEFVQVFPTAGTYYFACTNHGFFGGSMRGSITVNAATDVPGRGGAFDGTRLAIAPNPVLAGARIGFSLALPADVDLAVYDLTGRLVRRLEHGRLPAGEHHTDWDGRDAGGRALATGIYWVQLQSPRLRLQSMVVKLH